MDVGTKKLDGIEVRNWLRNYFASEKECVTKYLERDNVSKARDSMNKDCHTIEIMNANGFPMKWGNLRYHRVVMNVPGMTRRFIQYQTEWEANGNTTTAKQCNTNQ